MAGAEITRIEWWLERDRLPHLSWARLREYGDGTADVLTCYHKFGGRQSYPTAAAARDGWLSGHIELDKLTAEDRARIDIPLSSLVPPTAESDGELVERLFFMPFTEAGTQLYAMLDYVPQKDWHGLERRYAEFCSYYSGPTATARIAAVDTVPFEVALAAAVRSAVSRAKATGVPVVYVEYAPEHNWQTLFRLFRNRIDDPYSFDWQGELVDEWYGPALTGFAGHWANKNNATPGEIGRIVYLAARMLALAGRVCQDLDAEPINVYFARYDDWDSIVPLNLGSDNEDIRPSGSP